MEHQVLFRNRIGLLLSLAALLFGCFGPPEKKLKPPILKLKLGEANLVMKDGLVFFQEKPFTGELFLLFPNSNDTAEISNYFEGRENGEWKKFYHPNKIKEIRYFKYGQKTGIYEAWWENGNKQLQYFFVTGEYQGTCREWNEKGQLSKISNYSKGYEDGLQKWWYDGGKIKANYIIKDGRRYGLLGTKNCTNVSDSVFKN
jgi:antitoxin component YwqK of YwqJK toxin-antitoxin module